MPTLSRKHSIYLPLDFSILKFPTFLDVREVAERYFFIANMSLEVAQGEIRVQI